MRQDIDQAVEALREALRDWREGYLRVLDLSSRIGEDSEGATALFLEILLPSPPEDEDTWPVEAVVLLQGAFADAARETVRAIDPALPVYLSFRPETEEEQEEVDESSVATG